MLYTEAATLAVRVIKIEWMREPGGRFVRKPTV